MVGLERTDWLNAGKKVGIIVSVGIAAAAAGIVVMAAIAQWRTRQNSERNLATHLRDVQDVLSDCYSKIKAIERHLPQFVNSSAQQDGLSISGVKGQRGTPVPES